MSSSLSPFTDSDLLPFLSLPLHRILSTLQ
jgi:hypothetical protein